MAAGFCHLGGFARAQHGSLHARPQLSRKPLDTRPQRKTPWRRTSITFCALKDPRFSPAKPFYVGKGTGSRAYDHLVSPDRTRKYSRIKDITDSGARPLVDILVEDLTEAQALRLEAELISAFGTEDSGGLLTNSVVPAGIGGKRRNNVIVPQGAVERAQLGLGFLKTAILALAKANPAGISNSDAASLLGLRSDYRGRQKNYLSYSVLGLLLREGKVKCRDGGSPRHVAEA